MRAADDACVARVADVEGFASQLLTSAGCSQSRPGAPAHAPELRLRRAIDDRCRVELSIFDEVGDALRALAPPELGEEHHRAHRYGVKVWFGPATPPREHYEAQVVGPDADKHATVLAIEVGFHSEYAQAADNDAVISHLLAHEKQWRRAVGKEAQVGGSIGRPDKWRRVSETWPDPDLGDGGLVIEIAMRLTDYITALEPVRRRRPR
jgi:hypothetical protein